MARSFLRTAASLVFGSVLLAVTACGGGSSSSEPAPSEIEGPDGFDPSLSSDDNEYGKPLLAPEPTAGKADSTLGPAEMPVSADTGSAAVWEIQNQWSDRDTPAAQKEGMAWPANSGMDWQEKYEAWVAKMAKEPGHETYYDTFTMLTPFGKTLPAPSLECAEVALFARATFAAWYKLPFFVAGGVGRNRLVFGHFGALRADGSAFGPTYKTRYEDHTASWQMGADWPKDSKLRRKKLGGSQDDFQPFIAEGARAGAYFDEIFLNKRVGHFMLLLLSYFGSVNLASTSNTFNLAPEAIKAGDVLLERWQRRGIGHTLLVKSVMPLPEARLEVELLSGSMPRRQPKWDDPAASKGSFTNESTGSSDMSSDGVPFSKLGGGIKRFRIAVVSGGKWINQVREEDRPFFIPEGDLERIGARPARFESLLGEVPPEEKRDSLLQQIEDYRNHLRQYPASCSARIHRENAFGELYALSSSRFSEDRGAVDRKYRKLEDYVFAPLVYEGSKTCCWNSSTAEMYELIMEYNRSIVNDGQGEGAMCVAPAVFKEREGDYGLFKDYAESVGKGHLWKAWSEDEPCAQRDTVEGAERPDFATAFCDIAPNVLGTVMEPQAPSCEDAFEGNASSETAKQLEVGEVQGLKICEGLADWYRVSADAGMQVSVGIAFSHEAGDLDLEVLSLDLESIDSSTSTANTEQVVVPMPEAGEIFVKVYGYSSATNDYTLTLEVGEATTPTCEEGYTDNTTAETAQVVGPGDFAPAAICDSEADWFLLDPEPGAAIKVTLSFTHELGDLDAALLDSLLQPLAEAVSGTDDELLEAVAPPEGGVYLKVFGYEGATNSYGMTIAY